VKHFIGKWCSSRDLKRTTFTLPRGEQKNRTTEKTEKTEKKITKKTEPKKKTELTD
jgi:hypothetical protein